MRVGFKVFCSVNQHVPGPRMFSTRLRFLFSNLCLFLYVWPAFLYGSAVAQRPDHAIVGQWQGALHRSKDLRTAFLVEVGDDGKLQATYFGLDQENAAVPVQNPEFDGRVLRLNLGSIGVQYEGTLSPDGSVLRGMWKQGGEILPLELRHVAAKDAWVVSKQDVKPPLPMPANANPAFEVGTIKPSPEDGHKPGIEVNGRTFYSYKMTVRELLAVALELHATQIISDKSWIDTQRFDVSGVPDSAGEPNEKQWNLMLKKMLYERLNLKTHAENRRLPAFVLSVSKGGPKLARTQDNVIPYPALYFTRRGRLVVRRGTLTDFCSFMQNVVFERPVIDQTGLEGKWDFTLNWLPDETQFHGVVKPRTEAENSLSPLGLAIQEQLGLQLSAGRPEVPVIIVDEISEPTAN